MIANRDDLDADTVRVLKRRIWFGKHRTCPNCSSRDCIAVKETMSNGIVRPALECTSCKTTGGRYIPKDLLIVDLESMPNKSEPNKSETHQLDFGDL